MRGRALLVGLITLAVAAPLSVGTAVAADGDRTNADGVVDGDLTDVDEVREMADSYNRHADGVSLGPATSQLANNAVNLHVTDAESGETVVYSFRMGADRNITDVAEGENPDANLRMDASASTVEAIADADDPAAAFRGAYASDDVSIKPTGFAEGGAVKWTFWTASDHLKGVLF